MPEYQTSLNVNFWAPNEEAAGKTAMRIGEMVFVEEEVNSIEAPFAPVFVRGDDE